MAYKIENGKVKIINPPTSMSASNTKKMKNLKVSNKMMELAKTVRKTTKREVATA